MLQIVFAVLAGLLTVVSPCILPVLPIILGGSLGHRNGARPLFIVGGFVFTFTAAGIVLSLLARQTGLNTNVIRDLGIIILAIFGMLLFWPKLFERFAAKLTPFFSRFGLAAGRGPGNFSGFALGATLGLVWTPCAGPVLAAILTLVALQTNLLSAAILLFAYSLGAGVPMLLIAYGGQYASTKTWALTKYTQQLQQLFGFIIILLAVAMYFNYDVQLYAVIIQNFPALNPKL